MGVILFVIVFFQTSDAITDDNEVITLLQHYSNVLFATNFGINFVLYCISGQNFRKALYTLFCPNRVRRRQEYTQATGENSRVNINISHYY